MTTVSNGDIVVLNVKRINEKEKTYLCKVIVEDGSIKNSILDMYYFIVLDKSDITHFKVPIHRELESIIVDSEEVYITSNEDFIIVEGICDISIQNIRK